MRTHSQREDVLLDKGDIVREILGEEVHEQGQVLAGGNDASTEEDLGPEGGVVGGDKIDGAGGGEAGTLLEGVNNVASAADGNVAWIGGTEVSPFVG